MTIRFPFQLLIQTYFLQFVISPFNVNTYQYQTLPLALSYSIKMQNLFLQLFIFLFEHQNLLQFIALFVSLISLMDPQQEIPGSQPTKKVKLDNNELNQLKKHSLVVADTGQFNLIQKYKPEDSTTNPTLILQASQKPQFHNLIKKSIQFGIKNYETYAGKGRKKKEVKSVVWQELEEVEKANLIDLVYDHLSVSFGCQILKIVPGYVSTEVDAKLSFDRKSTIERAKRIVQLYKNEGADINRILIKIASTWEGIQAGQALKKDKIKTNMTLVFHKIQAIACANSGLYLISPFVGRILDWYKKETGKSYQNPTEDPGVISVTQIYNYYKRFGYKTIVMGASFRSTGQIKQLCGCDRLTISPKLLEDLASGYGQVPQKLNAQKAETLDLEQIEINENIFRYEMNKSKMATDLLSAGIRKFQQDGDKLKSIIRKCIQDQQK